jgi:hypothetical protein
MITQEKAFGGALRKIQRLGLAAPVEQVRRLLCAVDGADLPDDLPSDHERSEAMEQDLVSRLADCPDWNRAGPIGVWVHFLPAGSGQVCTGLSLTLAGATELSGVARLSRAVLDGDIDLGILVILGDEIGIDCPSPPALLCARRRSIELAAEGLPLLFMRFCWPRD